MFHRWWQGLNYHYTSINIYLRKGVTSFHHLWHNMEWDNYITLYFWGDKNNVSMKSRSNKSLSSNCVSEKTVSKNYTFFLLHYFGFNFFIIIHWYMKTLINKNNLITWKYISNPNMIVLLHTKNEDRTFLYNGATMLKNTRHI